MYGVCVCVCTGTVIVCDLAFIRNHCVHMYYHSLSSVFVHVHLKGDAYIVNSTEPQFVHVIQP